MVGNQLASDMLSTSFMRFTPFIGKRSRINMSVTCWYNPSRYTKYKIQASPFFCDKRRTRGWKRGQRDPLAEIPYIYLEKRGQARLATHFPKNRKKERIYLYRGLHRADLLIFSLHVEDGKTKKP